LREHFTAVQAFYRNANKLIAAKIRCYRFDGIPPAITARLSGVPAL